MAQIFLPSLTSTRSRLYLSDVVLRTVHLCKILTSLGGKR